MKKSPTKLRSAFSLLEISIIFVIVGIILATIIRSSSIYTDYKLNTARSLTASSDVSSIQGLILWLDATAEKSFDSAEREDRATIGTWYDINPTMNPNNNAIQTNTGLKPLYVMDAINNLPALKFDGTNDFLKLSSSEMVLSNGAPETANNFTIFVVAKPDSVDVLASESTSGTIGTNNKEYLLYPQHGVIYPNISAAGAGIAMGTNGISVYEHSSSYLPAVLVYATTATKPTIVEVDYTEKTPSLYVNGSLVRTTTKGPISYIFPSFSIGGGTYGYYSGYIAEIIIYNRVLLNDERESVSKYLSKKWGIRLI
jgi:type II secretory pathway pseudopilin PulG